MSNATSQLQVYLEQARNFAKGLVQRIEESSAWEHLMNRFEALDPTQKRQLRGVGLALGLALPTLALVYPLTVVFGEKSRQAAMRDLIEDMREFNLERAVERRAAPAPSGFQNLPIGSASEAEESISQYFSQIGITPEIAEVKSTGGGFSVDIKELTVRQLVALTYQMDGWYPALIADSVKIAVHESDKTLLTLQATYRYLPENAGKIGQGLPRMSGAAPSYDDDESPVDQPVSRPPPSASSGGFESGSSGSGSSTYGGDGGFDSGYDDYSGGSDVPADDFGDLPPPPSFDEDL